MTVVYAGLLISTSRDLTRFIKQSLFLQNEKEAVIESLRSSERALRESEARISSVLSLAPEAIIATDADTRVQMYNQGAERMFGYTADEIKGQLFEVLIAAKFRQRVTELVDALMAARKETGQMPKIEGLYGIRKDGSEFPAEVSLSKLDLGDDTILTAMLQDVTDWKRVEADLTEAKELAEFADRAKSEFLANMSHELRTPLNAIIGFSEMMTRRTYGTLGDAHYEGYSQDIFKSGELLLSLINDILDISKIESGRAELNETEVDTARVIEDCLRLTEGRATEAGVRIRNKVDSGLPMLRADERRVKQMLVNLISNAVKFTERGGEVMIAVELAKSGTMNLSVADNGIGIAAHHISKAMSVFGQVDGALERKFDGTGLGLPLVKLMAELHNGGLEIESEIGVGTKATIWFPKDRIVGGP